LSQKTIAIQKVGKGDPGNATAQLLQQLSARTIKCIHSQLADFTGQQWNRKTGDPQVYLSLDPYSTSLHRTGVFHLNFDRQTR
jgi:hypothetical protein